jgi:hypothetical protein
MNTRNNSKNVFNDHKTNVSDNTDTNCDRPPVSDSPSASAGIISMADMEGLMDRMQQLIQQQVQSQLNEFKLSLRTTPPLEAPVESTRAVNVNARLSAIPLVNQDRRSDFDDSEPSTPDSSEPVGRRLGMYNALRTVKMPQLKPPNKFNGRLAENESADEMAIRLDDWLLEMESYLSCLRKNGSLINDPENIREFACYYLSGEALRVANDTVLNASITPGLDHPPMIVSHVKQALMERVGGRSNGFEAAAALDRIKQSPDESVDKYLLRFLALHRKFDESGSANPVVSVRYFINGLNEFLQPRVTLQMNLTGGDWLKKNNLDRSSPALAVHAIAQLAKTVETCFKEYNETRQQFRSTHKPRRNNQDETNKSFERSSNAKTHQSQSSSQSRSSNRRLLDLPQDVVKERRNANVCMQCGQPGHYKSGCKNTLNRNGQKSRVNKAATEAAYDHGDHCDISDDSEGSTDHQSEGKAKAQ